MQDLDHQPYYTPKAILQLFRALRWVLGRRISIPPSGFGLFAASMPKGPKPSIPNPLNPKALNAQSPKP